MANVAWHDHIDTDYSVEDRDGQSSEWGFSKINERVR